MTMETAPLKTSTTAFWGPLFAYRIPRQYDFFGCDDFSSYPWCCISHTVVEHKATTEWAFHLSKQKHKIHGPD